MAALIIESKNPENLKLLAEIAKKMGDKAHTISIDDMEDLVFGKMMDEVKTGKTVSRENVMQKLGVR
jgi:4-hydroxy-3-methylbut-2-enyl diphosphate reductase IspH